MKNNVTVKFQVSLSSYSDIGVTNDEARKIVRNAMSRIRADLRDKCLDRSDDEIWVRCLSIEKNSKRMVD